MKKTTNKLLSIILSVLLLFSVMPMTVFATGSVASVTTVSGEVAEYTDIHEAFAFACENASSTITLLRDIDLGTDEIHIVDCDITLELNGKTLSSTSNEVVWLHRGGKMLIKDSVGNGTIKNTGDDSYAIANFGELTIESGTFIGKSAGVFTADRVVIKDGTFTGDEYGLLFWLGGSVNINDNCDLDIDAEWLDGKGQILGGTFINGIYIKNWGGYIYDFYEPTLHLLDILADGYGFFDEDGNEIFATEYQTSITGNITVKESENERPNVAKVELANGETEYFIDIFAAFRYASGKSGRIGDYNPKIVLLKDVVLSRTIQYSGWNRTTIDLNGKTLSSSCDVTLDIKGSTITDSLGGGAVVNTAEENGVAIQGSTLILNNVNVISNSFAAICETRCRASITINGGSIYGKKYGICGSLDLTITDGVIKSDSTAIYLANYWLWGDNYLSSFPAKISGGTIIGGIQIASGNTFYLKDIICEGYYFYDTEDNLIELTEKQSSIDETVTVKNRFPVSVTQPDGTTEYFPTVDEGVDKANKDTDSVLKLLKDILLNSSLVIDGTTTLDLNGKKLEIKDAVSILVENGASLNIEDSADSGTIGGGGIAVNGGTLNFNSGTVESTMDGIYNNGGSITVNGGAISSGDGYDDIFVEGENSTIVYGGAYEDGFSIGGTTINEALADGYVFYNDDGVIEIEDNQKVVSDNVVVYEKTIVTAMSSQIRFNTNDDGSYAGTFDVRTRAKISDADFKKYIADTNEEAIEKISKVGFVYSTTETDFNTESAKIVAQGGKVDGLIDAPVSYIVDDDGYYMYICMVTGITEEYLENGIITYAYICIEDTWYFFPVEVTAEFSDLYYTYYPMAAEQYGW